MSTARVIFRLSTPFALSLSKGVFRGTCFDKLSTNGSRVVGLTRGASA